MDVEGQKVQARGPWAWKARLVFIICPVRNRGHKAPGGMSDGITSMLQTDSGRSVRND